MKKDKKPTFFAKSAALVSVIVLMLAVISVLGYFAYPQVNLIYQANQVKKDLFTGMTKQEMELLLEDANPMMLKRLAEDPEMKKQQLESVKQLLALANQALKEYSNDEETLKALEIVDAVMWARSYDKEINKDKDSTPPFGFITDAQVKAFYGEGNNLTAEQKQNAVEFEEFLKVQLNFARKNNSVPEDILPSDEEKDQMRQEFAKIRIYEKEAKAKVKSGQLPEKFVKKVELQSKLQQAQFLSRLYTTELAKKNKVTDEEIQKYITEHPELNIAETKKAKAKEILQRLKKGEDFAKLAKQYSDDPGSKDKGGLYENVTEGGSFDPKFESAVLALQPGQFTQDLVETPYGYHIIKLEKKGTTKDSSGQVKQSYTVRHILFSTMIKDPENPMAREMPVKDFVKTRLEEEKEKKSLDKIMADNQVTIAEDFVIPEVTDKQIQEMMKKEKQQQEMSPMSNSNSNLNVNTDKSNNSNLNVNASKNSNLK